MPNKPRPDNPARAVRVPDDLWHAAQAIAAERGETVSDVIRRALERYIATPDEGEMMETRLEAAIPGFRADLTAAIVERDKARAALAAAESSSQRNHR